MYARKYLALILTLALLLPCMTALGAEDTILVDASALLQGAAKAIKLNENASPATIAAAVQSTLDTAEVLGVPVSKDAQVEAGFVSALNDAMRVEGHTDVRGTAEYNIAMGEARAMNVVLPISGTYEFSVKDLMNLAAMKKLMEENPGMFKVSDFKEKAGALYLKDVNLSSAAAFPALTALTDANLAKATAFGYMVNAGPRDTTGLPVVIPH